MLLIRGLFGVLVVVHQGAFTPRPLVQNWKHSSLTSVHWADVYTAIKPDCGTNQPELSPVREIGVSLIAIAP